MRHSIPLVLLLAAGCAAPLPYSPFLEPPVGAALADVEASVGHAVPPARLVGEGTLPGGGFQQVYEQEGRSPLYGPEEPDAYLYVGYGPDGRVRWARRSVWRPEY